MIMSFTTCDILETTYGETVLRMEKYDDFTIWLTQWLEIEFTKKDSELQVVIRRNPTKGDGELRHLLMS